MFIFFQTSVSPIGLSDMAVITVNAFFPPTPCYGNGDGPKAVQARRRVGSNQHRAKWGFSKCRSHSRVLTGDIRAACKYIQMTEGINHRVGFPISLVHPVMVPFFGGWSLFS